MYWASRGLIEIPDVTLAPVTAPVMFGSLPPVVEDGFVLSLVVGKVHSGGIFGPEHVGDSVSAGTPLKPVPRLLESMRMPH